MLQKLLFVAVLALLIQPAMADYACGGVLASYHAEGLKKYFDPEYSPALVPRDGDLGDMVKRLTSNQLEILSAGTSQVATVKLTVARAEILANWLRERSDAGVPGWIGVISSLSPNAIAGFASAAVIEAFDSSFEEHRRSASELAGTVKANGVVSVAQLATKNDDGEEKFVWFFTYTADINDKSYSYVLYSCGADIVVDG